MTNFPDHSYLEQLRDRAKLNIEQNHDIVAQLQAYYGLELNWVADFITDENIEWKKEHIKLDDLFLTGINPEWNEYIKNKAQNSPITLRTLMESDSQLQEMCTKLPEDLFPILIRKEGEHLKVLDGMYRVVKALWDGKETLEGYIASSIGLPAPWCEPHVVYDILRAYQRGPKTDKSDCIAALRYFKNRYANVEYLLRTRFSKQWVQEADLQEIISEVLK